jgi:hypothetical protein
MPMMMAVPAMTMAVLRLCRRNHHTGEHRKGEHRKQNSLHGISPVQLVPSCSMASDQPT